MARMNRVVFCILVALTGCPRPAPDDWRPPPPPEPGSRAMAEHLKQIAAISPWRAPRFFHSYKDFFPEIEAARLVADPTPRARILKEALDVHVKLLIPGRALEAAERLSDIRDRV